MKGCVNSCIRQTEWQYVCMWRVAGRQAGVLVWVLEGVQVGRYLVGRQAEALQWLCKQIERTASTYVGREGDYVGRY